MSEGLGSSDSDSDEVALAQSLRNRSDELGALEINSAILPFDPAEWQAQWLNRIWAGRIRQKVLVKQHLKHGHIPPLDTNNNDMGEDIVEQASKDLQKLLDDEAPVAISQNSVIAGEVVDFAELERLNRGETIATDKDDIDIVRNGAAVGWSIRDLMT
ncbi:hypothetical protein FB451DRAFT_1180400 [Mycena latifolia]|nr:hypothetical protein FB451DRAFT_1180400 [Mycena latifolia]